MKIKICELCASKFECKETTSCWCFDVPFVKLPDNPNEDCICPKCLEIKAKS